MPKVKTTHAAAIILVDANKRVLIAERQAEQIYPGYWEFPGGKLEKGETPESCICREVQEEVGVTPTAITPLTFISETREPEDSEACHVIVYIYLCRQWEDQVHSAEGQKITWVTPEKLEDYKLLPANIPLIPLLRKVV